VCRDGYQDPRREVDMFLGVTVGFTALMLVVAIVVLIAGWLVESYDKQREAMEALRKRQLRKPLDDLMVRKPHGAG